MISSQNNVRKYRTKGHEQVICTQNVQLTERQLTVALSHVVGQCAYIYCAWANFPIWEPKTRFAAPHSGWDLDICSELEGVL